MRLTLKVRMFASARRLTGAVRALREELHQLQEPGSYVGEVVKPMGKTKILVKVRVSSLRYHSNPTRGAGSS